MMKRKTTKQELLDKRLSGERPRVSIAGKLFCFHIEDSMLLPLPGVGPKLCLEESDRVDKGYRFLYRPATGQQVADIPADSLDFPKDILIVEVPLPVMMDPVGFALEHGIPCKDMLQLYPMREQVEAKIIPWRMTRYTRLIEENNWAKDRAQQAKVQQKIHSGAYRQKRVQRDAKKNKSKGI